MTFNNSALKDMTLKIGNKEEKNFSTVAKIIT